MLQLLQELDNHGVAVTLLLKDSHPFAPYLQGLRNVRVYAKSRSALGEAESVELRPAQPACEQQAEAFDSNERSEWNSTNGVGEGGRRPQAQVYVKQEPTTDLNKQAIVPQFLCVRIIMGELREAWRWSRVMRREKFDIVHSFEGGSDPGIIAAALARVPHRAASYCVLPTLPVDARPGDFGRRILEWISAWCAHVAITKSRSAKADWMRRLPRSRRWMRVIYNGMRVESLVPPPKDRLQALRRDFDCEGRPVIGMTARLHPMKGHAFLIEAIPSILKSVPDAVLLLVGDGELQEDLQAHCRRLGVADAVRFAGFRRDVLDLTWLYDVAVLPSVAYETFGWAVLEAMACGKPVVVSDFDGLPEVVEDGVTGTVVPPRDSPALAEAIALLLRDPGVRDQYGRAGRKRVAERFSYDRMIAEHWLAWGLGKVTN
jgi:glycosyltransferase involved in cell wall biosynthesis